MVDQHAPDMSTSNDDSSYVTDSSVEIINDVVYDDENDRKCKAVKDILVENRVTSTITDYNDGELVFFESDM